MADDGSHDVPGEGDTASPLARTIILLVLGLLVLGAVLAAVAFVGDGDQPSDVSPPDTVGEASAPATESPPTDSADTEAPETEASDPAAQDTEPSGTEPATTEPPETEPSATEPATTEPPKKGPPDAKLAFTIGGIEAGQPIPQRFTCDGPNEPPVVTVTSTPQKAQQLAFLVDDPDAPSRAFVHWVVYGISPAIGEFSDGRTDVSYGLNDVQLLDWFGPCPPPGDGPHGYVFTLFALDQVLDLEPGLDGRQLRTAIEPAILGETTLVATYER